MSTTAQSRPTAAPGSPCSPLSDAARTALLAIGRRTPFTAGSTLLAEGLRAASFYIVQRGEVKMTRVTAAGKNLILSLFGPGDLLGVTPALSGEPCSASWEALTDGEALAIERGALFGLLAREPSLVPEILPWLTRQLADCKGCLVESSCSRVESRLASLFLGLAERMGQPGAEGVLVPLALSRQELADLTGTTLETAIRVMSRWSKEELVSTRRDGFLLHDRQGLLAMTWS